MASNWSPSPAGLLTGLHGCIQYTACAPSDPLGRLSCFSRYETYLPKKVEGNGASAIRGGYWHAKKDRAAGRVGTQKRKNRSSTAGRQGARGRRKHGAYAPPSYQGKGTATRQEPWALSLDKVTRARMLFLANVRDPTAWHVRRTLITFREGQVSHFRSLIFYFFLVEWSS